MSYNSRSTKVKSLADIDCSKIVGTAKKAFASGKTRDVKFRKKQVKQLLLMIEENMETFYEALTADLNKPPFETKLCEISLLQNEIADLLNRLDDFVKPQYKEKTMLSMFDSLYVQQEPLGVCLIMGAWNYPMLLSLSPMAGAMAAGNCVILKLSEHAPYTAGVVESLAPKYLDNDCYHIVNCDIEATKHLLSNYKYDHIFYTGGDTGAKAVYREASKTLTPVVLELGGKSPVYVDEDVQNKEAVWLRIFWGKFLNAGQTCVAPDYVLCSEKAQDTARKYFKKTIEQFYGGEPSKSKDYPRIVNQAHFDRLKKLLKESRLVVGGNLHPDKLQIEPAIIPDSSLDDSIMREEIFGPFLPFVTVNSAQEAIDIINSREKPLALYVFSNSSKTVDRFNRDTSSGSLVVNDVVIHISSSALPFGGVGNSGIGKYHGLNSLETFSNSKAVMKRNFNPILEAVGSTRYPPYSTKKLWVLDMLAGTRAISPVPLIKGLLIFAGGAASVLAYNALSTIR